MRAFVALQDHRVRPRPAEVGEARLGAGHQGRAHASAAAAVGGHGQAVEVAAPPIEAGSASQLCAELGISRQTFYRYTSPTGQLRPDAQALLARAKTGRSTS